jgi:hypothetical protein
MNPTTLGIAIVSYDTRDLLRECLASVAAASDELAAHAFTMAVCVVDNASSDGSVAMVAAEYPDVDLIVSDTNEGFGAGCNRAIARLDARYILLLNPDARVSAETLLRCMCFADEHRDVGIIGCRILLPDGTLDRACKRGIPTPLNALCYFTKLDRLFPSSRVIGGYNATYVAENDVADVGAVVGAYMWVRAEVFEQIGTFDETFFMYGEDLDVCFRAGEAGWRVTYLGDCSVYHVKGASSGIFGDSAIMSRRDLALRVRMVKEFHRAMLIFYSKHYEKRYPAVVRGAVHAAVRLRCRIAVRSERARAVEVDGRS